MGFSSHAGAGPRRMASHAGGGGWPGGLGGIPPGPFGGVGSLFGDGSYSGNVIQGGSVLQPVSEVLTITAAATVAPDGTSGASVVMCDTLILDGASASLKPSTNSKGLIIFAKTKIELKSGAKLNIDKLGKAGNFGNLTAYSLTPASLQRKLKKSAVETYVVSGEGAAGAAQRALYTNPVPTGAAASAMQTGGGGAGGGSLDAVSLTGFHPGGNGGKGGPCCGGAGGGAGGYPNDNATAGGAYGGPGGAGGTPSNYNAPGGAGDPVGASSTNPPVLPNGAGGGLLMLFTPSLSISAGCIVSSDGGNGGSGVYPGQGGGSAGGGCVVIVTKAGGYANSGTVRASGGASMLGDNRSGAQSGGGGVGSVNTFTV